MDTKSIQLGHLNTPREMSENECAYWGGILDGEGSICVARAVMKRQRRPQFRFFITIANTNFEVLQALQKMVGVGAISNQRRTNDKWKNVGHLILNSENAAYCLEQVAPFLIIKSKQAELGRRFMALKRQWSRANDNWLEQETCYNEMRALNARGKGNEVCYQFEKPEKVARGCSFKGCASVHYGNGFCRKHYRWTASPLWQDRSSRRCDNCGDALPPTLNLAAKFCTIACKMQFHRREGCYTPKAQVGGRLCEREGCERAHHSKGMCRRHYMQEWHAANG